MTGAAEVPGAALDGVVVVVVATEPPQESG